MRLVSYEVYNDRGALIDVYGKGRFDRALRLKNELGPGAGIEMVIRDEKGALGNEVERRRLKV